MADADAAVDFRVQIKQGSDVLHDEMYILDMDAPDWERFDLTYSEQRRCEKLLSAVRDMWGDSDRHTTSDELSEPIRALLAAMIDIVGEAIARTVNREPLSSMAEAH